MTAPHDDATTDPQSIIAALQQRLDAALSEKAALAEELAARTAELAKRTAELTTRNSEYGEQIEHQSATIDVLECDVGVARRSPTCVRADHATCFGTLQLTRGPLGV